MTRATREQEKRQTALTYQPPSSLDVPKGLTKFFDDAGFHLRWIRWQLNGFEDTQNITKRIREGYEFINKAEIPEEYKDWFETHKVRKWNQAICINDLALGKIDKSRVQARQRYTQGLSEQRVDAARREASHQNDDRMTTMVPVFDESESEVEIS